MCNVPPSVAGWRSILMIVTVVTLWFLIFGDALTAQVVPQANRDGAAVAFEVTSVRTNKSGVAGGFRGTKGRTYLATNQALRFVIADAYGIPAARVLDGPAWIGAASVDGRFVGGDRFDITAKMPGDPAPGIESANLARLMWRTLLAERFQLKVHMEDRELPVYALVLARPDGRPIRSGSVVDNVDGRGSDAPSKIGVE